MKNQFLGVDGNALRRPPTRHQPRTKTLDDGSTINWFSECGYWGDHFRAGHTADNTVAAEGGNLAGSRGSIKLGAGVGANNGANEEGVAGMIAADLSDDPSGPFSRLRLAGLI